MNLTAMILVLAGWACFPLLVYLPSWFDQTAVGSELTLRQWLFVLAGMAMLVGCVLEGRADHWRELASYAAFAIMLIAALMIRQVLPRRVRKEP